MSEIKLEKQSVPSLSKGKSSFPAKFCSSGNHLRAQSDHIPEPMMTLRSHCSRPSPIFLPTGQPGTPACPRPAMPHLSQTPTHYLLEAVGTSRPQQLMHPTPSHQGIARLHTGSWGRQKDGGEQGWGEQEGRAVLDRRVL